MILGQKPHNQALVELRATVEQVIQNYDNPPLSLEKMEKPRVDRDEFIRVIRRLAFSEPSQQKIVSVDLDDIRHIRRSIAKLPAAWHNRIDYSPILDSLDKWEPLIQRRDELEATVMILLGLLFWATPFLILWLLLYYNVDKPEKERLRDLERQIEEKREELKFYQEELKKRRKIFN